jgi:uncharacterized protein YfbU (UPF0304 family)
MKTYMNRIDREHHLMILIVWDYLGSWLEKTSCLTKDERKRIKTATTHLLHASDSIVRRLEYDYARKILKDVKNIEIRIIDRISESLSRTEGGRYIDVEDLYDLASFSLKECVGCKKANHKDCERYQLFMKLNIPVAQEQTDGCPYEN